MIIHAYDRIQVGIVLRAAARFQNLFPDVIRFAGGSARPTERRRPARLRALAFALAVAVTGAACSSGSPSSEGQPPTDAPALSAEEVRERLEAGAVPLTGWATADGPLAGAQVRITALDGSLLGTAEQPTNSQGHFYALLDEMPGAYRVTVSGGHDEGGNFDGTLVSVQDHGHRGSPVHVGPATTLVAHHLDSDAGSDPGADPAQRLAKAQQAVAKLLAVPENLELARHSRVESEAFSGRALTDAARAHPGGFDDFIAELGTAVGTEQTRAFRGPAANGIADALVSAAVKSAAAQAFPELLGNALEAKTYAAVSDLRKQVASVQMQINRTEADLTAVLAALDLIRYDSAVADVRAVLSQIDHAWTALVSVIDSYGANQDTGAALAAATAFTNYYYNGSVDHRASLGDAPEIIDSAMTGDGSPVASALNEWTSSLATGVRIWTYRNQFDVATAAQYWAMVQSRVIAANTAYAAVHPEVGYDVDTWRSDFAELWQGRYALWAQQAQIDRIVQMPDVFYDQATHLVWFPYSGGNQTNYDTALSALTSGGVISPNEGTGWAMPTHDQLQAMFTATNGFGGWTEAGAASPRTWLRHDSIDVRGWLMNPSPDSLTFTSTVHTWEDNEGDKRSGHLAIDLDDPTIEVAICFDNCRERVHNRKDGYWIAVRPSTAAERSTWVPTR